MNENIDLTKILKGCPKGTKFYSSIWGTVIFAGIVDNRNYPIWIKSYNKTNGEGLTQSITKDGRYFRPFDGECTLFPSKDQRDWAKFERFWDKPSDKILARDYPKTYEECISKLRINRDCKVEGYKCDLLTAFQKLLICRNAYWKIAGEEMGLDKPWKPDWSNKNELKYCIENNYVKGIHYDVLVHTQKTLAFPTYEMRDAFYDNFNEKLIEQCKELL